MRSFASDNNSGVHPLVMEALNRANQNHAVGYGDDPWTKEAVRKIKETFSPDCEPLFVFNGTGSNAVALQLATRPYNLILCAETARAYNFHRMTQNITSAINEAFELLVKQERIEIIEGKVSISK